MDLKFHRWNFTKFQFRRLVFEMNNEISSIMKCTINIFKIKFHFWHNFMLDLGKIRVRNLWNFITIEYSKGSPDFGVHSYCINSCTSAKEIDGFAIMCVYAVNLNSRKGKDLSLPLPSPPRPAPSWSKSLWYLWNKNPGLAMLFGLVGLETAT